MNNYKVNTPVIFLTFNRPDTTQQVFDTIRQVKPPILLVSSDGARKDKPRETEKCAAVRKIIDTVDWNCEVIRNYSEENLGSYEKNSSSLTWAFNLVEEAIILEDDCLPNISFFRFCEELLDYYRHDEKIMLISGDNFQFNRQATKDSYYFSRYAHIWGWASWRRSWQSVDLKMEKWSKFRDSKKLKTLFHNFQEYNYWNNIFENMYTGKRNFSWDYQLLLSSYMENQLSIIPNVNLVSNVGFGKQATNTKNNKSYLANIPKQEIKFPLQHPNYIVRNKQADDFTYKTMFSLRSRAMRKVRSFINI